MTLKERKILVIDFLCHAPPTESSFDFGGIQFTILEHSTGWDFDTAEALIRKHDGFVDGIALSGLRKLAAMGKTRVIHGPSMRLIRAANRSQIYLGDDIRNLFADWTLKRLLKKEPHLFRGKRTLFHCAVATPFYPTLLQAGALMEGADAMLLAGMPVLLKGEGRIETFLKGLKLAQWAIGNERLNPHKHNKPKSEATFLEWVRAAEVFVSYGGLIDQVSDLSVLKGKVVVVDFLTAGQRQRVENAEPALLVEFVPQHPSLDEIRSKPFPVLTAAVDQMRLAENSTLSFNDYTLNWISKLDLQPNRFSRSKIEPVRRCGFVIHPLSQRDLWKVPGLDKLKGAPKNVRGWIESAAARMPIFPFGQLTGAVSDSTGQEVICDIFAIPATPKQLLSMDEEFVYDRLVKAAEMASKRGALLFGLGAYTKVVGDAGVTVAKRSPIPVTTGNSYSVATTLWAARVVLEKLGFIGKVKPGQKKVRGKAMIIGATGSIGRVAALLVAHIADEVVLVGPRPDKLLELREEMRTVSPDVKVIMTTNANSELHDAVLIVTATSNQSGSILDIQKVKPGAVICDCSRPLDISAEDAKSRPDVLVIESGEVDLPGHISLNVDIGLPKPSVYACMAETILLTMEGRYEPFTLSREISMDRVKEIYKIGLKHGAKLSAIRGHEGVLTEARIVQCRNLAIERLRSWPGSQRDLEKVAVVDKGVKNEFTISSEAAGNFVHE